MPALKKQKGQLFLYNGYPFYKAAGLFRYFIIKPASNTAAQISTLERVLKCVFPKAPSANKRKYSWSLSGLSRIALATFTHPAV
ncbi:hypothetical protein HA38_01625 [Pantoea allii]|uniref:hypothetical protein n=1 Tax=Pantoea allii TaxID=574096 RepID=UPI000A2270A8|nr:hypothetical protein HA38_01625 [Pantoea allii]